MKANAPEKIYRRLEGKYIKYYDYKPAKISYDEKEPTEYVLADAFIEKACEYISEHVEYYMKKDKACNVPLCPLFATKSFIENFRKYMKGE